MVRVLAKKSHIHGTQSHAEGFCGRAAVMDFSLDCCIVCVSGIELRRFFRSQY